ncbi:histone H3.3-like isoform X3 [Bombus impatiens]|uniref:Histone H3.3-like isoform X3 n=1 Tax=Bombus impatiens TaxID=132113 RepID=A0A6P3UTQ0_BOMIM|nr:histone H3.3-like isoform X3 [Bombus impatiens]
MRQIHVISIDSSRTAHSDKSRTDVLVDRRKIQKAHILKEIRYFRKSVELLIPKLPFARIVKEIMTDLFPRSDVRRVQPLALEALQEAAEAYLVQFFEDCVLLSQHGKRVTLQIQDMILMRRLRGRDDIINK